MTTKRRTTKRKRQITKRQYVIVRTYSAGVHVGVLQRRVKGDVTLTDSRRIWRWRGANTLNELSIRGADLTTYTRISEPVPEITLTQAIEIIPVTEVARVNLTQSRWL